MKNEKFMQQWMDAQLLVLGSVQRSMKTLTVELAKVREAMAKPEDSFALAPPPVDTVTVRIPRCTCAGTGFGTGDCQLHYPPQECSKVPCLCDEPPQDEQDDDPVVGWRTPGRFMIVCTAHEPSAGYRDKNKMVPVTLSEARERIMNCTFFSCEKILGAMLDDHVLDGSCCSDKPQDDDTMVDRGTVEDHAPGLFTTLRQMHAETEDEPQEQEDYLTLDDDEPHGEECGGCDTCTPGSLLDKVAAVQGQVRDAKVRADTRAATLEEVTNRVHVLWRQARTPSREQTLADVFLVLREMKEENSDG